MEEGKGGGCCSFKQEGEDLLRISLLNKTLEGRRTVFDILGDTSMAVGAAGAKVLGQAAWHTSTKELCLEWRDAAHLCTANVRALRR